MAVLNKLSPTLAATVLLALAPTALAQSTTKKLYCWNENGRKVCGDALPSSAVNNARTEFSVNSGRATAHVGRALQGEELAAAERAAHADRLAAMAAESAKRRDHAMAESYDSETALRRAYQHRITLLEETVKASELGVTGLRQSLLSLLRRASDEELAGKPVPRPLAESILGQHQLLQRQQGVLAQQRMDRSAIDDEFNSALERYRALKTPSRSDG